MSVLQKLDTHSTVLSGNANLAGTLRLQMKEIQHGSNTAGDSITYHLEVCLVGGVEYGGVLAMGTRKYSVDKSG